MSSFCAYFGLLTLGNLVEEAKVYRLKACVYACIVFPNVFHVADQRQKILWITCDIPHIIWCDTCLSSSQKSYLHFLTLTSIRSSLALHWCTYFDAAFVFTMDKFSASVLLLDSSGHMPKHLLSVASKGDIRVKRPWWLRRVPGFWEYGK